MHTHACTRAQTQAWDRRAAGGTRAGGTRAFCQEASVSSFGFWGLGLTFRVWGLGLTRAPVHFAESKAPVFQPQLPQPWITRRLRHVLLQILHVLILVPVAPSAILVSVVHTAIWYPLLPSSCPIYYCYLVPANAILVSVVRSGTRYDCSPGVRSYYC